VLSCAAASPRVNADGHSLRAHAWPRFCTGITPFPPGSIGTDSYLDQTAPQLVQLRSRLFADATMTEAVGAYGFLSFLAYHYDGEFSIQLSYPPSLVASRLSKRACTELCEMHAWSHLSASCGMCLSVLMRTVQWPW
jgi:hypothetical protein